MRNPLNLLKEIWNQVECWVDGMVHPDAHLDALSAPLHKSYLLGCFLTGAAAFFVLPLHLALAGPPHVVVTLVLAWMLSQWPLAHYLSQSGQLDRAIGISASSFAVFVAAICFLTGGADSFAVLWLLVPPVEAAFATNRRTSIFISVLTLGLFILLLAGPTAGPFLYAVPVGVKLVSGLVVLAYVGLLCCRLIADRSRAKALFSQSTKTTDHLAQTISDVVCEISATGSIRILGGPLHQLLGAQAQNLDADWVFERMQVADRPLYLCNLAETRTSGASFRFNVRMRTGANRPGDTGAAEYALVEMWLRPLRGSKLASGDQQPVVLSLRPAAAHVENASSGPAEPSRVWDPALVELACTNACAELEQIIRSANRLSEQDRALPEEARQIAKGIEERSRKSMSTLSNLLDMPENNRVFDEYREHKCTVGAAVATCLDLIGPLARERGVDLEFRRFDAVGTLACDAHAVQKTVSLFLADVVQKSSGGTRVILDGEDNSSMVKLRISVRRSGSAWNVQDAAPLFAGIKPLIEAVGGSVKPFAALGQGEGGVLSFPVKSGKIRQIENPVREPSPVRQLAQSA